MPCKGASSCCSAQPLLLLAVLNMLLHRCRPLLQLSHAAAARAVRLVRSSQRWYSSIIHAYAHSPCGAAAPVSSIIHSTCTLNQPRPPQGARLACVCSEGRSGHRQTGRKEGRRKGMAALTRGAHERRHLESKARECNHERRHLESKASECNHGCHSPMQTAAAQRATRDEARRDETEEGSGWSNSTAAAARLRASAAPAQP